MDQRICSCSHIIDVISLRFAAVQLTQQLLYNAKIEKNIPGLQLYAQFQDSII